MKMKDRLKQAKQEIIKTAGKVIKKAAKGAIKGIKAEFKETNTEIDLAKATEIVQQILQQPRILQQFQQYPQQPLEEHSSAQPQSQATALPRCVYS